MPTGSERIAWLGAPYADGGTFLTIPAHQLMPGLGNSIAPASDLQDRVVLIGVIIEMSTSIGRLCGN
jgi:hypothetical protein